jgi:8-oxo-dGTP pyrophosphatase MutT (NUDIX family)
MAIDPLGEAEETEICSRGHRWLVSWHPPADAPAGKRNGAAGICLDTHGEVVVISTDGLLWDFPAGRPEGDEDWEQTLRREMLEEACAVVTGARLLGYSRGRRIEGITIGPPSVRSLWLAQVDLLDWAPQFEIRFRRLVPVAQAIKVVLPEYERFWTRVFQDAGLGEQMFSAPAE